MIYILEFEKPLGNAKHQARYYIGYCADGRLHERLKEHLAGTAAAITRACVERNIGFMVVATMPGNRSVERRLKREKNTRRIVERIQRQEAIANETA
jgi:putative endonuclease